MREREFLQTIAEKKEIDRWLLTAILVTATVFIFDSIRVHFMRNNARCEHPELQE